jgi:hypothetical protein
VVYDIGGKSPVIIKWDLGLVFSIIFVIIVLFEDGMLE